MAVNIGYSIGWGDIAEPTDDIKIFSTVYVIIGASFVGVALGFFADSIVANCNDWYVNAQIATKYKKDMEESSAFGAICIYTKANFSSIRPLLLWVIFVAGGTFFGMDTQNWNFIEGLYFSISSMSTGGHWSLEGGTDNQYFLTGVFSAFGVPIMGVAMATLASFFIETGSIEETMEQIREEVTKEEIDMMQSLGLADSDGEIDKAEFLVLCMVRTGAADPALVKLIQQYFDLLDADGSGTLNFKEVTASARDLAEQAAKSKEATGMDALYSGAVEDDIVGGYNKLTTSSGDIELGMKKGPGGKFPRFSVIQLQTNQFDPEKDGFNAKNKELGLEDWQFQEIFGMSKEAFMKLPAFRRKNLKMQHRLL